MVRFGEEAVFMFEKPYDDRSMASCGARRGARKIS